MRRYLRRVENCRYRPFWRWLSRFGIDPTGHGWTGWLSTELAAPAAAFADDEIRRLVVDGVLGKNFRRSLLRLLRREADPNDQRLARRRFEGAASTPLTQAPVSGISVWMTRATATVRAST